MKSIRASLILMLVITLVLSGCAVVLNTPGGQLGTKPTVDNLFTPPVTNTTKPMSNPTLPQTTEATNPTIPPYANIIEGNAAFGPAGDFLRDERGHYFSYDGGEMCMNFLLGATGTLAQHFAEKGVGILLYLDGQPQPYRLEQGGELSYCHVIYPTFDVFTGQYYFDVYFVPVAGEKGDMVELFASNLPCPDWKTDDPEVGFRYTMGCCYSGTRLKLNEDPAKAEKPDVMERVTSMTITREDVVMEDILGWSDSDLIERYAFEIYVNGEAPEKKERFYGFSADEEVELRFEIWGTPYVKYGLMFYIDNVPISAEQEIYFDMKNGQKTVVTVTIDISDFDGECAIYASLIPRNCRSTDIMTNAFQDFTPTLFLLDDPEPTD